jgi:hypothetical protein
MGDNCTLRTASASRLFLYLVFVIIFRGNPDSQRQVAGNGSNFLTAHLKISRYSSVKLAQIFERK